MNIFCWKETSKTIRVLLPYYAYISHFACSTSKGHIIFDDGPAKASKGSVASMRAYVAYLWMYMYIGYSLGFGEQYIFSQLPCVLELIRCLTTKTDAC